MLICSEIALHGLSGCVDRIRAGILPADEVHILRRGEAVGRQGVVLALAGHDRGHVAGAETGLEAHAGVSGVAGIQGDVLVNDQLRRLGVVGEIRIGQVTCGGGRRLFRRQLEIGAAANVQPGERAAVALQELEPGALGQEELRQVRVQVAVDLIELKVAAQIQGGQFIADGVERRQLAQTLDARKRGDPLVGEIQFLEVVDLGSAEVSVAVGVIGRPPQDGAEDVVREMGLVDEDQVLRGDGQGNELILGLGHEAGLGQIHAIRIPVDGHALQRCVRVKEGVPHGLQGDDRVILRGDLEADGRIADRIAAAGVAAGPVPLDLRAGIGPAGGDQLGPRRGQTGLGEAEAVDRDGGDALHPLGVEGDIPGDRGVGEVKAVGPRRLGVPAQEGVALRGKRAGILGVVVLYDALGHRRRAMAVGAETHLIRGLQGPDGFQRDIEAREGNGVSRLRVNRFAAARGDDLPFFKDGILGRIVGTLRHRIGRGLGGRQVHRVHGAGAAVGIKAHDGLVAAPFGDQEHIGVGGDDVARLVVLAAGDAPAGKDLPRRRGKGAGGHGKALSAGHGERRHGPAGAAAAAGGELDLPFAPLPHGIDGGLAGDGDDVAGLVFHAVDAPGAEALSHRRGEMALQQGVAVPHVEPDAHVVHGAAAAVGIIAHLIRAHDVDGLAEELADHAVAEAAEAEVPVGLRELCRPGDADHVLGVDHGLGRLRHVRPVRSVLAGLPDIGRVARHAAADHLDLTADTAVPAGVLHEERTRQRLTDGHIGSVVPIRVHNSSPVAADGTARRDTDDQGAAEADASVGIEGVLCQRGIYIVGRAVGQDQPARGADDLIPSGHRQGTTATQRDIAFGLDAKAKIVICPCVGALQRARVAYGQRHRAAVRTYDVLRSLDRKAIRRHADRIVSVGVGGDQSAPSGADRHGPRCDLDLIGGLDRVY